MNIKKIFQDAVMILLISFLFVSTPSQAMLKSVVSFFVDVPETICPAHKRILSTIRTIKSGVSLDEEASEEGIRTKCQMPPYKENRQRASNSSSKIPSLIFAYPIPESAAEQLNWKDSPEYNFGSDGREKKDPSVWPNCAHGVVQVKFPGDTGWAWGTGALIGRNIVLTAAHNLYDPKKSAEASEVRFLPANAKGLSHAPKVINFYYPNAYQSFEKEDYGILVLDSPLGEEMGYFGLNILTKKQLEKRKNTELHVVGYPSKIKGENVQTKEFQLWGMNGKFSRVDDNCIYYKDTVIRTCPGQSGSVVFYKLGEHYYVVGTHVRGTQVEDGENEATFLTRARYDQIQKWISKSANRKKDDKELSLHDLHTSSQSDEYQTPTQHIIGKFVYGERANGDFIIDELVGSSLSTLRKLDLSNNSITYQGAKALASASLTNLEELNLGKNTIGFRMIEYFGGARGEWDSRGIEALSKASLPKLKKLNLEGNTLWKGGVKILVEASWWPNLRSIHLGKNHIGDEGIKLLVQGKNNTLEELNLENNGITKEGAENLSKGEWSQLKILNLRKNEIRDEGVKFLVQSKSNTLEELNLEKNNVTDEGAKSLIKEKCPNLNILSLRKNEITLKELKKLRNKFPQAKIVADYLYFDSQYGCLRDNELLRVDCKRNKPNNIKGLKNVYKLNGVLQKIDTIKTEILASHQYHCFGYNSGKLYYVGSYGTKDLYHSLVKNIVVFDDYYWNLLPTKDNKISNNNNNTSFAMNSGATNLSKLGITDSVSSSHKRKKSEEPETQKDSKQTKSQPQKVSKKAKTQPQKVLK